MIIRNSLLIAIGILFAANIVCGAIPASERAALIALYNATDGDNWKTNTGWKVPPLESDGFAAIGTEHYWYGVYSSNFNTVTGIDLNGNQLLGSIPPELGNLPNLSTLRLDANQLSGSIPPELGNLTNLVIFYLNTNRLSGPIPPELGNLTNLSTLRLYANHLSGSIPPELGNLTNLVNLYLGANWLSGPIPPEIGNLGILHHLSLDANKLSGEIPPNLASLTELDYLNIGYNALYTNNSDLIAFLNSKDPDWPATQTIAPGDVVATTVTKDMVELSWTPIAYTGDTGGYRVYFSLTSGGPYTFYAQTTEKTVNGMSVSGLPGRITYYFVVQTWTDPHIFQMNMVTSENSQEVSGIFPEDYYIVSGAVTGGGVPLPHVILYADGGVSGVYSTDGNGNYQVVVPWSWSGTITPEKEGFVFTPPQMSYTNVLGNHYNQDYFATSGVPGIISVVSPNGSEEWDTGSLRSVTWNGEGIVGNVKVEYSTDNAATWTDIAAATPNDGILEWTVPDTPSAQCRVRVTDLSNPAVSDGCDECFSITASSGAMFINDGTWTTAVEGVEGWYVGDFTGDGLEDLMNVTLLHQKVFASDGTQFVKLGSWMQASSGLYGWFPGDFNGDGKTDLLRYRETDRTQVFLSSGSAFVKDFVWAAVHPGVDGYTVGDFNGDGYDDMLIVEPGNTNTVFLSTGTTFGEGSSWFSGHSGEDGWYAGDFNGDGKTDLARVNLSLGTQVILSTGTAFEKSGVWTAALPPSNGWFVADYNGDGRDDLMRCLEDLSGAEVFLSTGGGFAYDGCWCDAALLGADWRCGKFSADGRADLLRYDVSAVSSEVFVSTPSGGVPASAAAARRGGRKTGDLNLGIELRRPKLSAAQETELLSPFLNKLKRGEEGNYFLEIKRACEKALGRKVRDTVIHRMLHRHRKPEPGAGIR